MLPPNLGHRMQFGQLKRREFIALFGGAMAWPLAARAQRAMPVVGLISGGFPETAGYAVTAFRQGLNENGYVEGQNVAVEYRWARGRFDLMPDLVADLLRRRVTVIASTTRLSRNTTLTLLPDSILPYLLDHHELLADIRVAI